MQEPNVSYPFTERVGSFAEQRTSEDALKMGQMAACQAQKSSAIRRVGDLGC